MSTSPAAATRPARSGGFTTRKLAPYLFVAPVLLLFIAFISAPLVYAFYMSHFRDPLVDRIYQLTEGSGGGEPPHTHSLSVGEVDLDFLRRKGSVSLQTGPGGRSGHIHDINLVCIR